jgi:hypothetical protein
MADSLRSGLYDYVEAHEPESTPSGELLYRRAVLSRRPEIWHA